MILEDSRLKFVKYRHRERRDTAHRAWLKCWRVSERHGAVSKSPTFPDLDKQFIRSSVEADYASCVAELAA